MPYQYTLLLRKLLSAVPCKPSAGCVPEPHLRRRAMTLTAQLMGFVTACASICACNSNSASAIDPTTKAKQSTSVAQASVSAGAPVVGVNQADGAPATGASTVDAIASADSTEGTARSAASTKPARPGELDLLDDKGAPVTQISGVVSGGDSLYFLTPSALFVSANPKVPSGALTLREFKPPGPEKLGGVPIQEFLSLVYYPPRKSVVVLDKSGSLFEFVPSTSSWKLFRANKQTLGTPDPHYISVAVSGASLLLLDPERNQIWRYPAKAGHERYFREVLPWRVRKGDPWVADAVGLAHDDATYVLRRRGIITRYPADSAGGNGFPSGLKFKPPANIRPSKLVAEPGGLLYVIERENNRVLSVNRSTGQYEQYQFAAESDVRSVLPSSGGFWALTGPSLVWRARESADKKNTPVQAKRIDMRLDGLTLPVKKAHLPAHTGVFPGARRLYRHGVHQGLDFFADAGPITMNTPAVAAEAGKVIRADVGYKDMDAKQYSRIMTDCEKHQYCSDANEDLFRGCQVWIDHGSGLITRYAHLNKARADLKPGMHINRGDLVGYIGVSGTGENLRRGPGHPHLHFEIWLDGHYLGYGLNPAETVGVYEDIFGRIGKRGN